MTRLRLLAATAVVTLAATAAAVAAPDRTTALSAAAPSYSWDGALAVFSLAPLPSQDTCTKPAPGRFCDETLLEVTEPGRLSVEITDWNTESDLDLFLMTSDADGSFGDEIGSSLNEGPGPEKVSVSVNPGFYLVFVSYFQAVNSAYKGKATFASSGPAGSGTVPPTGDEAGTDQPASPGSLQPGGPLAAEVRFEKAKIRALLRSGVPLTVSCTVACKAVLSLKAKVGRRKAAIGRATVTISEKQQLVKVKLTAKARKAFRKAKKVKVALAATITDSSGGQKQTFKKSASFRR